MASVGARLYALVEGVSIALDSLRANKVRAGLTMLGVAVGVFVVVVISAAIHGINQSVAEQLESTGPTTFLVLRFPISFEACDGTADTCAWRHNPALTLVDVAALNDLPSVRQAGARVDMGFPVRYLDRALSGAQVTGFTSNWTLIEGGGDFLGGRTWSEREATAGDRVVIINDEMAKQLFGESDPVNKDITIRDERFHIIGVFTFAASFLSGGNRARAMIPIQTAFRTLNASHRQMGVTVIPLATVTRDQAIDDVTSIMRQRHSLRPAAVNDFAIVTQEKLFDTYNSVFGMFFLVMIVLSAIGLIVGGVGVVAIMMISVTERTREIGVRKALGATAGLILWQFLVEAVTLTGIGAIIGLVVGMVAAAILKATTPIAASVPPLAIVAALASSALTGILFGIMPAARAAKLNPVDALRYE